MLISALRAVAGEALIKELWVKPALSIGPDISTRFLFDIFYRA